MFLLGTTAVLGGWLAVIALNLPGYLGQNYQYRDRFDLLSPSFYLDKLITEPRRYNLGLREAAAYTRAGFWLLVIGLPGAYWRLGRSAWRACTRRTRGRSCSHPWAWTATCLHRSKAHQLQGAKPQIQSL
jgi:hypothetical protein